MGEDNLPIDSIISGQNPSPSFLRRAYIYRAFYVISAIVSVYFIVVVFSKQTFSEFVDVFVNVSIPGVIFYVLLSFFGSIFRALRYRVVLNDVLDSASVPSFKNLLCVTLVRNALVDLLPARLGEVSLFAMLCGAMKLDLAAISAVFGVCFVLDIVVLGAVFFLVCGIGVIGLLPEMSGLFAELFRQSSSLIVFGLMGFVLLVFSILLFFADVMLFFLYELIGRFSRRSIFCSALSRFVLRAAEGLSKIKKSRSYPRLILLTVCVRFCKYFSLYVLLLSVVYQYGIKFYDMPFVLSFICFAIAEAAASLPFSGIMGFGAYEAAWVVAMRFAGIKLDNEIGVAFIVHLITQIDGYALGVFGFIMFAMILRGKVTFT